MRVHWTQLDKERPKSLSSWYAHIGDCVLTVLPVEYYSPHWEPGVEKFKYEVYRWKDKANYEDREVLREGVLVVQQEHRHALEWALAQVISIAQEAGCRRHAPQRREGLDEEAANWLDETVFRQITNSYQRWHDNWRYLRESAAKGDRLAQSVLMNQQYNDRVGDAYAEPQITPSYFVGYLEQAHLPEALDNRSKKELLAYTMMSLRRLIKRGMLETWNCWRHNREATCIKPAGDPGEDYQR